MVENKKVTISRILFFAGGFQSVIPTINEELLHMDRGCLPLSTVLQQFISIGSQYALLINKLILKIPYLIPRGVKNIVSAGLRSAWNVKHNLL